MPDSTSVPFSLAKPIAMRRGYLSERLVKCSKPACPCATDPKARHGPYFSLTRPVKGRTQSRFLSPAQATLVRQQLQRGRQLRSEVDDYWKRCEQEAERELNNLEAPSQEAAKKRGSKPTSKQRSKPPRSRKSRPS